MTTKARGLAALALLAIVAAAADGAHAGYVTGAGSQRAATLVDPATNTTVEVALPEVLDGEHETSLAVTVASNGSAPPLVLALAVSPDDPELRAAWTVAIDGGPGTYAIVVPAEALPYRRANVPFALELAAAGGAPLDRVDFSVDLTYRPPPPDGGLLQLAAGTVAAWGLVLLYAVSLHRAHKRLLARADALERAIGRSGQEGDR